MVYLNKHDISIKSKMATINLHTGREKVCHFVYILIFYRHYCSQNLYFMTLWTDNFILFIQVVFPITMVLMQHSRWLPLICIQKGTNCSILCKF